MRNWLIIGLFVLQTLAAGAIGFAHGPRPAGAPRVALFDAHCGVSRGDDDAPSRHGRAAHCCILCVSCGCGAPPLASAPASAVASPPSFVAVRRRDPLPPFERKLAGWATSWSSRAPPSVS